MNWIKPAPEDCESAHCIEVLVGGPDTAVAHLWLRVTGGEPLLIYREEFAAFVNSAKRGHYDHLVVSDIV